MAADESSPYRHEKSPRPEQRDGKLERAASGRRNLLRTPAENGLHRSPALESATDRDEPLLRPTAPAPRFCCSQGARLASRFGTPAAGPLPGQPEMPERHRSPATAAVPAAGLSLRERQDTHQRSGHSLGLAIFRDIRQQRSGHFRWTVDVLQARARRGWLEGGCASPAAMQPPLLRSFHLYLGPAERPCDSEYRSREPRQRRGLARRSAVYFNICRGSPGPSHKTTGSSPGAAFGVSMCKRCGPLASTALTTTGCIALSVEPQTPACGAGPSTDG